MNTGNTGKLLEGGGVAFLAGVSGVGKRGAFMPAMFGIGGNLSAGIVGTEASNSGAGLGIAGIAGSASAVVCASAARASGFTGRLGIP